MKMNELKLFYFSPTGTTHKVVMETARSIDLKSVSFDLTIKKDLKPVAKFAPNDFALFAIPVYYGRVPALFLKYLDLFSGNGTPAALGRYIRMPRIRGCTFRIKDRSRKKEDSK